MELRELLKRLQELNGTDLHVIVGLPPAVRVNDELLPLRELGRPTPEQIRDMVYPILEKDEIERFERDAHARYELDFARGIADLGRFRFNLCKQRGSLCLTIRALSGTIPTLESLGMPASVKEFTLSRRGLILVTGPSGSGRSTTLASLMDAINHSRPVRIMTIEDPVEYFITSDRAYVTQREIGGGADSLSFENAIWYARRQNIDILMIGHLSGYESMRRALELAEMGLLVFACMSTLSAVQTLARFIECFPPEQQPQAVSQISAYLVGIIAQILLPSATRQKRVLACEVMRLNALIRSEVRQNRLESIYGIIQQSASEGMQTMDQSLIDLARQKMIDYNAARPYIREDSTHRTIAQLSGEARPGGAMAAGFGPQRVTGITGGLQPSPPSEPQPRRRLGSGLIPPWEKQER